MKRILTLLPAITIMGMTQVAQAQTQKTIDTMWQQQANMVNELRAMGLVGNDTVVSMTETDGVGDYDEGEDVFVSSSDEIYNTINNLSKQAEQKEDSLYMLSQQLLHENYSMNNPETPVFNVPVPSTNYGSSGVLTVRPITSKARMSSGFGYRRIFGKTQFHKGMDFAAPTGTPIYATGDGVVTISGWGNGYGRYIEIDHGNGLRTRYAHNSRNRVSVGDTVYANQHIADVGNTGRSTGPHLHYEVRQNGQAVNPQTYLALAPER